MSTVILFDTLEYSKRPKAQGFTQAQAEFQAEEMAKLARTIEEGMATKQDIRMLRQDLKTLEERLTYKLTIRLGALMITGITVLGILMTVLHK